VKGSEVKPQCHKEAINDKKKDNLSFYFLPRRFNLVMTTFE
jgi:hypothetical protein